jgi:hypothetical protein
MVFFITPCSLASGYQHSEEHVASICRVDGCNEYLCLWHVIANIWRPSSSCSLCDVMVKNGSI